MIIHMSFSGKFYGRENAAFSLVRALQEKIDVKMLLVIEERAPADARKDLIAKLGKFGICNDILYTHKMLSIRTFNELADKINQAHATIIHCHCHKSAFYSILLKFFRKTDAAVIFTLHGVDFPPVVKSMLHYVLYYASMALADWVIGCSNHIIVNLSKIPLIRHKVTAIQNAYEQIPLVSISKQDAREQIKSLCGDLSNKLLITNVGRLTTVKNPMLFLKVVKRIKEYCLPRNIPFHFIMVGDGELRQEVEQAAREYAINDCLSITGYVANMPIVYVASDILMMTSDSEGTPMCILEAMSNSLPIVVPSVGGIPDIIVDGETGLLFPKRNEDECVRQVIKLMESAELRTHIGKHAYNYYKDKFNYQTWSTRHIQCYEHLTSLQKA